jgi:hypothetical protein
VFSHDERMRSNETELSPPLAAPSFAAEFNVEVMRKLLIRTASGWLERLVRPVASLQVG